MVFAPKRHRGQNFLIDRNVLKKIVAAAAIKPSEIVVEIGAGKGVLTQELAAKARRVIAVELDKELIQPLRESISAYPNVEIIQDDCLNIPNTRYGSRDGEYAVIANIPYNITSRIIRKFLEEHPCPSRMILLVQREVAQRMRASPPDMNLLALSVQYYAQVEVLFSVSRNCFSPKPAVTSALVRIVPKSKRLPLAEEQRFFALISATFKGKRKRLIGTFAAHAGISKMKAEDILVGAGLSPNVRPQELSLEQWLGIAAQLL